MNYAYILNQIVGWDEGVLGMQLGEVARLRVIFNFLPFNFAKIVFYGVTNILSILESSNGHGRN